MNTPHDASSAASGPDILAAHIVQLEAADRLIADV
jgi:hypothetical protein